MLVTPIDPTRTVITVNGRTYAGTYGSSIIVPDGDGLAMIANYWAVAGNNSVPAGGMLTVTPTDPKRSTITVNGRTWTCPFGSTITVPYGDALHMISNYWAAAAPGTATGLPKFAFGTPIYYVGDSIGDRSYSPVGYTLRYEGKTLGRYITPPGGMRGSAGMNTTFAVKDLPNLLACIAVNGPGVVVIMHGTNADIAVNGFTFMTYADVNGSTASATTIKNLDTIINAVRAASCRVIHLLTPHTTGQVVSDMLDYATKRSDYGTYYRVIRADTLITNTGANDQGNNFGDTFDGTHPNDSGAEKASDPVVSILNEWSLSTTASIYDNDNSLIDGSFTYTTGGTVTAPVTGAIPDNWTINRVAGDAGVATAIVSKALPTSATVNGVRVTVTAGTTATQVRVYRAYPGAAGSISDHFDAWFMFQQISGPLNCIWGYGDTQAAWQVGNQIAYNVTRITYPLMLRTVPRPHGTTSASWSSVHFFTVPAGQSAVFDLWGPRATKRAVPNYVPLLNVGGGNANIPAVTPSTGITNGTVLTCSGAALKWDANPLPITFTYQWYAAGVPISGATASTYTVTVAEVGKTMTCFILATNSAGAGPGWLTSATAAVS